MRALLVDDDETIQAFLQRKLEMRGYDLTVRSSGREGLEEFEANPAPLILLDLGLPDIDGIDLCRRIRAGREGGAAIILAVTARSHADGLEQALAAGFDDYLVKPFGNEYLDVRLSVAEKRVRNLAEKRAAEFAFRESEEKYRELFSSVSDAVVIMDAETRQIVEVNTAALELYGHGREEFCSMRLDDLFEPGAKDRKEIENLAAESSRMQIDATFQHRAHGEPFPADISVGRFPLKGKMMLCAVVRDITKRIEAERERMISERLQGALEMAGAACHELNQPLQVVSGHSELLLDELPGDSAWHAQAETISRHVDRMSDITNKLQNITRYRTKEYIDGARIIDLQASSGAIPREPPSAN